MSASGDCQCFTIRAGALNGIHNVLDGARLPQSRDVGAV
jgi:hypothetical protein